MEESKARAKIKLPKLPLVAGDKFISSVLEDNLSAKDREKLQKTVREIRQRTRESLGKLNEKWEEECVLSSLLFV